jgi:hypothetical protein
MDVATKNLAPGWKIKVELVNFYFSQTFEALNGASGRWCREDGLIDVTEPSKFDSFWQSGRKVGTGGSG